MTLTSKIYSYKSFRDHSLEDASFPSSILLGKIKALTITVAEISFVTVKTLWALGGRAWSDCKARPGNDRREYHPTLAYCSLELTFKPYTLLALNRPATLAGLQTTHMFMITRQNPSDHRSVSFTHLAPSSSRLHLQHPGFQGRCGGNFLAAAQQAFQLLTLLAAALAAHAQMLLFACVLDLSLTKPTASLCCQEPQSLGTLSRWDLNVLSFSFSLFPVIHLQTALLLSPGKRRLSFPSFLFSPVPLLGLRSMSIMSLHRNYRVKITWQSPNDWETPHIK